MRFKKQGTLFYFILSSILFLSACNTTKTDELSLIQSQYLDASINLAYQKLEAEVQNTGSIIEGLELLEHAKELLKQQESILATENIGELMDQTRAYATFSEKFKTSKNTGTSSIKKSINELNPNNLDQFKSVLKLHTLNTITTYHHQFLELFTKFDIVGVNVMPLATSTKQGEDYEAQIIMISAMSTLKPRMLFSDKKDGEYTPLEVGGPFNQGHIKLEKLPAGKHTIYIKFMYQDGNMGRTINVTHEFYVLE